MKIEMTLKMWRMTKGYTQEEMAKKIGVHPNTYVKWEKRPDMISLKNADKIARIFGTKREEIFPQS